MLKVENITKYYNKTKAVDNLSFTVEKGEIFGLLGENGAGKTTTFRIILGLINASSGNVTLDGKKIDYSLTDKIGYVTEERSLLTKMTVKDQILLYGVLKGMSEDNILKEMRKWLKKFQIIDYENRKIKELMKKAYYVPETITVDKLFEEMRKNKKQISIVIEEHGGTSGIVTMEDILEEIVGEIYDEYDTSENKVVELDSNTYLIDGSLAIYDLEKIFDIEIPEGDYDTISGYLIDLLGRIPKPKENIIIETEQLDFKVEKVKNKKIVQVKVCKK